MKRRIFQYGLFLLCLTIMPNVGQTAEYWTSGTPMPIDEWCVPSAATLHGKIYIFGGFVVTQCEGANIVQMYDPEQDSWQTMTPMPVGKVLMGAAAVGDSIYLFGGLQGGAPTSTVWKYTPSLEGTPSGPWQTGLQSIGYPNQSGTQIVFTSGSPVVSEGKIYIFGGRFAPTVVPCIYADWHWYSTTWCYDPATDTWEKKANMPSAGSIPASAIGTKIYLVGGELDGGAPNGQMWVYDTTKNTWDTNLPNFPGGTILHNAICTINGRIYLAGGGKDWETALPWTWQYDPELREWDRLEDMPIVTWSPASAECGGNFYLFGGFSYLSGPILNVTQILHLVPPAIEALVDINPDSLNKNSKGQWVTVYITLPAGYDVAKIDTNTIAITSLTGTSCQPDYHQALDLSFAPQIGDRDEDGIADLTVKLSRQELIANLCLDDVAVTVEGKLSTGEHFKGTDHIRVLDRPK